MVKHELLARKTRKFLLTPHVHIHKMQPMHDLPTLLRVQRAALRLSQERAALGAGITFYRFRRFEEGMQLPTSEEINALAAVLVLTPEKLAKAAKATVIGIGAHA
jgi:hypothetical protein